MEKFSNKQQVKENITADLLIEFNNFKFDKSYEQLEVDTLKQLYIQAPTEWSTLDDPYSTLNRLVWWHFPNP